MVALGNAWCAENLHLIGCERLALCGPGGDLGPRLSPSFLSILATWLAAVRSEIESSSGDLAVGEAPGDEVGYLLFAASKAARHLVGRGLLWIGWCEVSGSSSERAYSTASSIAIAPLRRTPLPTPSSSAGSGRRPAAARARAARQAAGDADTCAALRPPPIAVPPAGRALRPGRLRQAL